MCAVLVGAMRTGNIADIAQMNTPKNTNTDPSDTSDTVSIVDEQFDQSLWDSLVDHPMQSWEWGEIRRSEGKQIVRLLEKDGHNEPTHCHLMTIHPIPLTPFKIGYIPKSRTISRSLIDVLRNLASQYRLAFVKFEPHIVASRGLDITSLTLTPSSYPLFTRWNQVLDLTPSEDDILSRMHHKTRYNIKLAQKKGVQVIDMTSEEGYNIFEELYFETCKEQGYRGHTPRYHANIWKHLGVPSEGASPDQQLTAHILVAWYKGKPLAVQQIWHFHDTLYYVYGGSSQEHKNVMASNLLMWETIRYGRRLGCKSLDMWGSLPPSYDTKDPWAGFTKFKKGYGTSFVQYAGSYDLVVNHLLYKVYSLAQTLRQRFVL